MARIDFESLNRLFRRSLAWPRSWTERPPSKKKKKKKRGSWAPADPLDKHGAAHVLFKHTQQSKQRFIRSKQQLQQFASPPLFTPSILLNFISQRGDQTVHKHEGTRTEGEVGKKIRGRGWWWWWWVSGKGGEGEKECSFKGNVQPGVKLQPIVLHIVPEAHSKNSNKKRNHPLTWPGGRAWDVAVCP